ncbi:MAG: hypothetical protein HYR96_08140 [Deltaproteobacteria bacterium]|nr:hypothetical protein [Deltaproteobacteria bacterium]MBI3293477.1 hypothetical protein [Deltaproteobacteria bacterium]
MKFLLLIVASLSSPLFGDVGLVYRDGRLAVLYQNGNRVLYRLCAKGEIGNLTRQCRPATNQADNGIELSQFQTRLTTLFFLPANDAAPDALSETMKRVEYYKALVDNSSPESREGKEARKTLGDLIDVHSKLLVVQRDFINHLSPSDDTVADQKINQEAFLRWTMPFYPNWFDGERAWIFVSPGMDQDSAIQSCPNPAHLVTQDDLKAQRDGYPNNELLLVSPLKAWLQRGPSLWSSVKLGPPKDQFERSYYPEYGPGERFRGVAMSLGPVPDKIQLSEARSYAAERWLPISTLKAVLCVWRKP